MRVFIALLSILLVRCAGCSDQGAEPADPWSVGEDTPDAALDAAESDGAVQRDMGVTTPDVTPDPIPPDDLPSCVDAEVSLFELLGSDFVVAPVVAADRVFAAGYEPDTNLQALMEWTEDGLVPRADSDREIGVLASSGSHIWLGSLEGPTSRFTLATNEVSVMPFEIDWARSRWNHHYASPRQNAVGDRVAWSVENVVYLADGDDAEVVGSGPAELPWITDRAVAYEFYDGMSRAIRVHAGGVEAEIPTDATGNAWPVLTATGVFFVRDGAVWAANLDGSSVERILDRHCGPLHTDGETVVTGCRPDEPEFTFGDYLTLSATEVWSITASTREPRQVAETDKTIFAPIVSERWLVWAEYDGDLGGQPPTVGRVVVLPRGEGGEPTEVGTIGNGCPYCGAYWPPPRLDLGENTIAWSYALDGDSEEMFGPRGSYAVARLRPCE